MKTNNYFLNISMADKESRIETKSGTFSVIHYVSFVSLEFLRTYSVLHLGNVIIITDNISRQLSVPVLVFLQR